MLIINLIKYKNTNIYIHIYTHFSNANPDIGIGIFSY